MKIYPGNRRYNSLTEYIKNRLGGRFQKVTVDAGFTCPNRDGTKGWGGCTYCNNNAFNPSYNTAKKSITQQIQEGIEFHRNRYRRASHYLVYFQPYSNTYESVETLKSRYYEALNFNGVKGLVIGTRPDCLSPEILDLLDDIHKKYFLLVELGVESLHDDTLKSINRGHTAHESIHAIYQLNERGIHTGIHLIFGLPGESEEMMMETVDRISALPVNSVKFHQLQIIKNTAMAKEYELHPEKFQLFTLERYLDFIVRVTERLNPAIYIDRFAAEVPPRYLAVSPWTSLRYDALLHLIQKKMEELNTWQGKFYISASEKEKSH